MLWCERIVSGESVVMERVSQRGLDEAAVIRLTSEILVLLPILVSG
jgi:hypothetical protein